MNNIGKGLKYNLVPPSPELSKGSFLGFTLQKGFWYGYDNEGCPVAASGWVQDDALVMYRRGDDGIWRQFPLPHAECEKLLPQEAFQAVFADQS